MSLSRHLLLLLLYFYRSAASENLWPELSIPFVLDESLDGSSRLLPLDNALAQLSSLTCVSFVSRTTEPNYVIFADLPTSVPCWNLLSMKGGGQLVNVGFNCLEPVLLPATVTRIFSDCDVQRIQYLYPCPGAPSVHQTNCTSIFNLKNNVPATIVPCDPLIEYLDHNTKFTNHKPAVVLKNCPFPTYSNNTLPIGSTCGSACDYRGRLLPFLRAYNFLPGRTDNFYTTDVVQMATLEGQGYQAMDPLGYLALDGPGDSYCKCLRPLHRLFHFFSNDHFYTTNETEKESATRLGYVYERLEGYCTAEAACGAYMPLSRYFNGILAGFIL